MKSEYINDLIEAYNKQDINKKRNEIINELKEINVLFEKLNKDIGASNSLPSLKNKDNFNKSAYTDDEFLEYMYSNVLLTKEIIGNYVDRMTDILYE